MFAAKIFNIDNFTGSDLNVGLLVISFRDSVSKYLAKL